MENCLKKEVLFDYYHESLDTSQMNEVKEHVSCCKSCQSTIDEIVEEIGIIKNSLRYLNPDLKEVPEFKLSSNQPNKTKKIEISRVLSWAAGICLFLTSSAIVTKKIIDNQRPVNDYEYFEYVPDMNDAWKENSISITKYDRDGNPIDHQIIGN